MWAVAVIPVLLAVVAGNPSCPAPAANELTVHLVCHTHDDVGWLKTVDQYYYGAKNTVQRAGVQYILDSVVRELQEDPARKFSYVETAFFYRWWNEQTNDTKEIVKGLVDGGQLEFVNGGWCMNDEAAAHYTAIVDQMTLGLSFLNRTFGPAAHPRVAWQIDPFGHSSAQASLFAQMGFDGLFFGRLDYADKEKRWKEKNMETVWQASQSLGEIGSLFTGVLPNGYNPPAGFCFDDTCGDQPIMDNPDLSDSNVQQMVDHFLVAALLQASAYRTDNIIMTMGSDFQYQNANTWYKNLDKLIKYVNGRQSNGSRVNVVYSTPSCYLDAVHAADLEWSTKRDDFFPYASDPHAYWTGYFTSRPSLKRFIRTTNAFVQAQKQIDALRGEMGSYAAEQDMAMGVAQHHDAVSGTAKQHVTDDYVLRLDKARNRGFTFDAMDPPPISLCPLSNISACAFTETRESFDIVVYNSIARPQSHVIRFPVPGDTAYKVVTHTGAGVASQLVPIPDAVLAIPYRDSTAANELVFVAEAVPALGFGLFTVTRSSGPAEYSRQLATRRTLVEGGDTTVELGPISVELDGVTGLLKSVAVTTTEGLKKQSLSQELLWYAGMAGNNSKFEYRASGAYIFRPDGTEPHSLGKPTNVVYEGDLVHEIQQSFAPWASQVIRLYKGSHQVEVEWMVGPIPIEDGVGKEVIARYTMREMDTDGTFYTDSNGREMIKRVRNHRDTWQLNVTEPVSGNYYPVTSRIMVTSTNGKGSFAVLNDRAQGGSSLKDGAVELMVHRRLLYDDAFGVGEPLNETQFGEGLIARGTHHLVHSDMATAECDFSCRQHTLAEKKLMAPMVVYQIPYQGAKAMTSQSGLTSPLPVQVHLMTLATWNENGQLLLRLEHMFQDGESDTYSSPVTVSLENLLSRWKITDARETTLSANRWLDETERLKWKVAAPAAADYSYGDYGPAYDFDTEEQKAHDRENINPLFFSIQDEDKKSNSVTGKLLVTLQPMEIRTFIVSCEKNPQTVN